MGEIIFFKFISFLESFSQEVFSIKKTKYMYVEIFKDRPVLNV